MHLYQLTSPGLPHPHSPQAEAEVDQFVKEEHTFLEYEKKLLKYKELVRELQYDVQKVG